ncbi:uncharacterized protein A4U43_C08F32620 [Asparagus officinalis]|nr:uncharacterized protein A4U43_C08F32620 [Asparagus officinalis]
MGEAEEYAVHLNQANKLFLTTPKSSPTQITIQPSSFEIFSFIPIKNISHRNLKFAPVGLVNMFNSGGTIVEVEHDGDSARVRVKGKRSFLAYSSGRPLRGMVDGDDVGFDWSDDGSLEMEVDWEEDKGGMSEVCFVY